MLWGSQQSGADGASPSNLRNAPSQPYLDRISVISHKPDAPQPWRRLLIQPVSLPSLGHTGILTAFDPAGASLVRPDGKVHSNLKDMIQTSFR